MFEILSFLWPRVVFGDCARGLKFMNNHHKVVSVSVRPRELSEGTRGPFGGILGRLGGVLWRLGASRSVRGVFVRFKKPPGGSKRHPTGAQEAL